MGESKFKGIPLQQGRTVILFDEVGNPLDDMIVGNRHQRRQELRRRMKQVEKVIRDHDAQAEAIKKEIAD